MFNGKIYSSAFSMETTVTDFEKHASGKCLMFSTEKIFHDQNLCENVLYTTNLMAKYFYFHTVPGVAISKKPCLKFWSVLWKTQTSQNKKIYTYTQQTTDIYASSNYCSDHLFRFNISFFFFLIFTNCWAFPSWNQVLSLRLRNTELFSGVHFYLMMRRCFINLIWPPP